VVGLDVQRCLLARKDTGGAEQNGLRCLHPLHLLKDRGPQIVPIWRKHRYRQHANPGFQSIRQTPYERFEPGARDGNSSGKSGEVQASARVSATSEKKPVGVACNQCIVPAQEARIADLQSLLGEVGNAHEGKPSVGVYFSRQRQRPPGDRETFALHDANGGLVDSSRHTHEYLLRVRRCPWCPDTRDQTPFSPSPML
jgi:hypothetical protein